MIIEVDSVRRMCALRPKCASLFTYAIRVFAAILKGTHVYIILVYSVHARTTQGAVKCGCEVSSCWHGSEVVLIRGITLNTCVINVYIIQTTCRSQTHTQTHTPYSPPVLPRSWRRVQAWFVGSRTRWRARAYAMTLAQLLCNIASWFLPHCVL